MSEIWKGRSLTQGEIDGYNRYHFIDKILKALEGGSKIRFLAVKKFHNLVEIQMTHPGEWDINCGDNKFYTHKFAILVGLLEKLYDEANIISLKGEFQIEAIHQTANEDAETDPEGDPSPIEIDPDK